MNVAIEYILRNNRAQSLFTLPCSLFLENADKKGKLVITMAQKYGSSQVIIRKFYMQKCNDMLPEFEQCLISLKDIFTSPEVILPKYKLLEFYQQPYNADEKQVSELPLAAIQEKQYRERLERFFSPKAMNRERENWLWKCFDKIFIDKDARRLSSFSIYEMLNAEDQRQHIGTHHRQTYKMWEFWKKSLLLNTSPAAELVFAQHYDSKFLKYVPEVIPEAPAEEPALPKKKKPNPMIFQEEMISGFPRFAANARRRRL